jgi:putative Mg2+ transporter-C (MgtC) family protein
LEACVFGIDWSFLDEGQLHFVDLMMRLAVATVLGGAIGIERERRERAAGFRTHALVCVASALMMVVSTYGFPGEFDEALDPSRIAAQVVSGIGFLGAGVIIFRKNAVRGLTTAASVWAVSGVGLAAGGGMYAAAIIGTLFMLLVQGGLRPLERRMFAHHSRHHRIVLEVSHGRNVFDEIQHIASNSPGFRLLSLDFDVNDDNGQDVVELTVEVEKLEDIVALISQFRQIEGVSRLQWHHGRSSLRRRDRVGIDLDDEEDEV